jgi:hypothetical protein
VALETADGEARGRWQLLPSAQAANEGEALLGVAGRSHRYEPKGSAIMN